MSSFQDLGVLGPKGVTRMLSLCIFIQSCLRGTHLGFCHRVIVKEKTLNLEKTTYSVLSVLLLIYVFRTKSRTSKDSSFDNLTTLPTMTLSSVSSGTTPSSPYLQKGKFAE